MTYSEFIKTIAGIVGERGHAYGGLEMSFERAAAIANLILPGTKNLTPADVSMVLLAVKLARQQQTPNHKDSLMDAANYVGFTAILRDIVAHKEEAARQQATPPEPVLPHVDEHMDFPSIVRRLDGTNG